MDNIISFFRTDLYLIILNVVILALTILTISLVISNTKYKRKYSKFLKKLGNGNNIREDLQKFINKVERVQEQNQEIIEYCNGIETEISKCIQKVGIVRYSAFKDTGSDLSFAVALLDEKNNGIVFNGIYSREMSNIYAKPVENGKSKYTLSVEEVEAINKAIG